ncbi:MAG TPA: RNA 2',3'-cyclic phosphodiesterase [Acidimicrobiales bacterium]|nr:RNA 2',3'-cyclic phosphodiesterase [Acidimicrobiales bacterium]
MLEGAAAPGPADDAPGPTARLFVGVWPPPEVVAVLGALDRPAFGGVRWTTPEQWHVTIAFLGNVPVSQIDEVGAALVAATARAAAPVEARLGPSTRRVGRAVLWVPVCGLEELAGSVRGALGALPSGVGLDDRFDGHLTLARSRGRRSLPTALAGVPLDASWRVGEVDLVCSELDRSGARYTTLVRATVPS